MAKTLPKIALSVSRDIPFNKLVLSQSNVRRIKAGVAIEELAEDIARRTLLQSLTVRPVCDADGNETGLYEVPAGGRRYRALELLIKKKRLPKTAPIPCVIRTGGIAEEDSLAENVQRAPLHPLDQFRAFLTLREKGQSEEEIAAAFFVSVAIVHQRLRLAAVAPSLLDVYAEDGMTLDQLMAFTVNPDHARQEQVWEALQRSYRSEPYQIRRMLTEGSVRVSDKRALFVGTTAYEEAGGTILRDLFESDDGGWLQEPALLEKLVADKLEREADAIRAEGWKWIEVAPELPYGHTYGLRRLRGREVPISEEEVAARDALQAELDQLEAMYAEADEIPEDVDQRLGEIETALTAFDERPVVYEPDEIARAGAFVSIDGAGVLHVERGYVQPEDESEAEGAEGDSDDDAPGSERTTATGIEADTDDEPAVDDPDEDEGVRPLSDRLLTELTTHRTLALRDAVATDPDVALRAALHALCLKLFYRYGFDTCLEIEAKSVLFGAASGLADSQSAKAIDARHKHWAGQMPKNPADLWDVLADLDSDSRQALLAHCVGLTINAVHQSYDRRPKALQHADRLATAVRLDMAAAGWTPTVDSYLGRVTKARILDAVREAKGAKAADRIAHIKKVEMAKEAERLLDGTGWLPDPLRTADLEQNNGAEASRIMAAE
ncbi:ParB/RepB/Spo0J family partition protein [Hyphomicrobium sp. DMF-1]|jgi:ParB family chromosome partitioning protein|uniref:ParB/RepB/Spo0J family partition protein n=1 Tax=Hyphomicrobium sp. DMF-1 TaxID=3019544 RepID=UPI0022EBA887|nr:ParB N-terminal domain-containing protein [Hyphomicrobium sp. DMF-1]WBT39016.1 ParB N-terminal domain-containing protein [Hyphomicrobium sp. DMF-1]